MSDSLDALLTGPMSSRRDYNLSINYSGSNKSSSSSSNLSKFNSVENHGPNSRNSYAAYSSRNEAARLANHGLALINSSNTSSSINAPNNSASRNCDILANIALDKLNSENNSNNNTKHVPKLRSSNSQNNNSNSSAVSSASAPHHSPRLIVEESYPRLNSQINKQSPSYRNSSLILNDSSTTNGKLRTVNNQNKPESEENCGYFPAAALAQPINRIINTNNEPANPPSLDNHLLICSDCNRSFKRQAYLVHQRVCKKVFHNPKNIPQNPQPSNEGINQSTANSSSEESNNKDWRSDSSSLREQMRKAKKEQQHNSSNNSGIIPINKLIKKSQLPNFPKPGDEVQRNNENSSTDNEFSLADTNEEDGNGKNRSLSSSNIPTLLDSATILQPKVPVYSKPVNSAGKFQAKKLSSLLQPITAKPENDWD
jgi:hypothetical protein